MDESSTYEDDKELNLDPDEITISAFEKKDKFEPKIYRKHKASGSKKSFVCYRNPAFDTSYDTFEEQPSTSGSGQNEIKDPGGSASIHIDISSADYPAESDDDSDMETPDLLQQSLPSTQARMLIGVGKAGSLRQRNKSRAGLEDLVQAEQTDNFDQVDGGRLVSQLQGLDVDNPGVFKEATVPLQAKKSFRRTISRRPAKRVGRWKQFKYSVSLKWDHFKSNITDFFKNLDIWKSNLKAVEGTFGTGVLSYFTFLRWLFFLNIGITLFMFGFVIAPQIAYSPSPKTNTASFNGLEFLTGEGWFTNTEMYYGIYHNETIRLIGTTPYNLPLAYLFVAGGYIIICVIILVRSMGISYKENYISGTDFRNSFFTKVFCSWDYAIAQKNSAKLQSKSIHNDLMESLSVERTKVEKTSSELCQLVAIRILTNFVVLALMAGGSYLIYFVANTSIQVNSGFIKDMLPAIVISSLNLILPFAFRIIASMEDYESPKRAIKISLIRTITLKLSSLCIYVFTIYSDVKCMTSGNATKCEQKSCWETWIGQSIYKLVIVDFIFIMLATFFGEFVRRIIAVYIPSCDTKIRVPGFDISRNVLDLIYAQGLCWLGSFFCPMLPFINVIKFFIVFYFKKYSVLRNCRPSMRPFKASKMRLLFLCLLGLMLLLSLIVVGYVIMSSGTLKPSESCGPFRGKASIYKLVTNVINNDFGVGIKSAINIASSAALVTVIVFVLGLLAYYFKLRKSSAEKKIKLLKEQIALAGQDKLYLLKEIRKLLKQQGRPSDHIVS